MVDEEAYAPLDVPRRWELGYLGTYGADRQPALDRMLIEVARRRPEAAFAVAGPQYPDVGSWPPNVHHRDHLAPPEHPAFYAAQRFTVNVTRADMVRAGWSPSVRLFEAAACGVPVISDPWPGLDSFFEPDREIFIVSSTDEVLHVLDTVDEDRRQAIAEAARAACCASTPPTDAPRSSRGTPPRREHGGPTHDVRVPLTGRAHGATARVAGMRACARA